MTILEKAEKIESIMRSYKTIKKSLSMAECRVKAMTEVLNHKLSGITFNVYFNAPYWKHCQTMKSTWKRMSNDKLEREITLEKCHIEELKDKLLEKEKELKELLNTP